MKHLTLLFSLPFLIAAALPEVGFTEDPAAFKDSLKEQSERLMGCWMMVREYDPAPSAHPSLPLIKQCMRRLTRADSRIKITEFAGKNDVPAKRLQDLLSPEEMAVSINSSELSEVDRMMLEYIGKF